MQQQVVALVARVAKLEAENAALRAEVEDLRARLGMNSQNSSKPPSSDGPQAPKRPPRERTGRKPGGQPGHDKHERQLVAAERVDEFVEHRPSGCEQCGRSLTSRGGEVVGRHQIWELPQIQARVVEHRLWAQRCAGCNHVTRAPLPVDVPRGCFGPRLMAVLVVLAGRFRLSRRETAAICASLFNIPIAVGSVAKICARAGAIFAAGPVKEVRAAVRTAAVSNVDETGFKCAGAKGWLWVVVTAGCTLFHLADSRGAAVAKRLLDKFRGVLGSDRWSGYNWYALRRRQICWAHLKRNLLAVYERGGYGIELGRRGSELVTEVFKVWHQYRDGPRPRLRRAMRPLKRELRKLLQEHRACRCPKARRFAEELLKVWPALWSFVRIEGIEPTNNSAERAIRPAVLLRKGSFGTQSADGARFVEGILTIAATCQQRRRPLIDYVTSLFQAHLAGKPLPALLTGV